MSLKELKEVIDKSDNIVFFGGAGTSTESHIPDFRSETGLYKASDGYNYPPEVMLSHDFFMNHTEEFYKFYKSKMIYKDAKPNLAHLALKELEKRGKLKAIITQNIDGLHQLAGSSNVLELHGSIHRNSCINCGEHYTLDFILSSKELTPICKKCGSTIKPDVVLYGEQLNMKIINRAIAYISNSDVFIIGGTSLVVYPAASLVNYYSGNKLILINKSITSSDKNADIVIHDSIGGVLNSII